MKVYGSHHMLKGKQRRCIFAGTQQQLADRIDSSLSSVRKWWTPTGNKQELTIALAKPGTLFYQDFETREYKEAI